MMYLAVPHGAGDPRLFKDAKRAAMWLAETEMGIGHVHAMERLELDPVDFAGEGIRQTYENFRHGVPDEKQPPGYLHVG